MSGSSVVILACPPAAARLMAAMFPPFPNSQVRLLDAGAGVGTLTAAICNRLTELNPPRQIHVEA